MIEPHRYDEVGIEGLVKRFGDHIALEIPELHLQKGHRYALIGPNGCGKSTLLRCIAGTIVPEEGTVRRFTDDIGYLPQKPYLFGFTVSRNVRMGAPAGDHDAVLAALRRVGMEDLAEERGSALSGGEGQRVACARVIARRHELLLLDEPTASMDIEGTARVEKALDDYCWETGCTLVLSTHAPAQALRMTSEAIILDHGRIVEKGTSKQVIEHPASEVGRHFLAYWRI